MTQPKLSRRQWFRLRKPHQNKMLDEASAEALSSITESTSSLQPVETPPNHAGLDLSELPPMREAILARQEVEDLFLDIEQLATDIQLMQRSSSTNTDRGQKLDDREKLVDARKALMDGTVSRVQIRYRWQDSLWIDTLKQTPDGFHIVSHQPPFCYLEYVNSHKTPEFPAYTALWFLANI